MDRTVEMAIEELRNENKFFANLEEHQLLAPLAIKYFCQRGEFSRNDYEAKVVDGAHDGGIDAVVMGDEGEFETPILIQAKYHRNITKDDCIQAARKIVYTCNAFADHRDGNYNKKLRKVIFRYGFRCDISNREFENNASNFGRTKRINQAEYC